jgi:hypothetical protein
MNSVTRPRSTAPGITLQLADTYVGWFLAFWGTKEVRPWRLRTSLFIGLLLICGATALTGAVPTRMFGHDTFFLLDNGWRAISGQRVHLDYYSPWGPVTFFITAAGLKMSHYSVNGIGYGNALAALLIGCWAFYLARNRLTPRIRVFLSFFLAALVAAPYALGTSPFLSSHAMVYNRYGYALVGLIVLETIGSSDGTGQYTRQELQGGVSTGIALILALFLKASFFLVAVGIVVFLSVLLRRLAIQRIAGLCLGGLFAAFGMMAYLHFNASAILGDLRMAAGARSEALTIWIPVYNFLNHSWFLLGVLIFSKVATILFGRRAGRWQGWKLPLIGSFFFFVDIALMSSNAQEDGFPTCATFVILVLSELMQVEHSAVSERVSLHRYYAAALCIGPLLCVPLFVSNLEGMGYGLWSKACQSPASVLRFTTTNLRPLLLYDTGRLLSRSNGPTYTTYVNDGVALLQRVTDPNETILTMDMVNPFPYAMGRRPPLGGIAAMAFHYTLGDGHRPSEEAYFGDADIVMVPKRHASEDKYYIDFWKTYEPGLRQRFKLIAESDWWLVYRRTGHTP